MAFDLSLFNFLNSLSHESVILDFLGIFFAEYLPYLLILISLFFLLLIKDFRQKFYFFSLAGLSVIISRGILTEVIRFLYYKPRPFLNLDVIPLIDKELTGSFPSGHATAYFALAIAVYYFSSDYFGIINNKWKYFFLGSAIVMGIARVFIGVHWPTDVIGGAIIGWASVIIVRILLPKPDKPK